MKFGIENTCGSGPGKPTGAPVSSLKPMYVSVYISFIIFYTDWVSISACIAEQAELLGRVMVVWWLLVWMRG